MSSATDIIKLRFSTIQQKMFSTSDQLLGKLCKFLAISGLLLYIVYIFLSHNSCCYSSSLLVNYMRPNEGARHEHGIFNPPTNLSHIVFGITGAAKTWSCRRWYIEAWWRPNKTRGCVFLDRAPMESWPSTSPDFRISEDTSRYQQYNRHKVRHAIRMARVIVETFRIEKTDVRWYVMADDDTVMFLDNLVEVLAKYDHRKYYYVGMNSECIAPNFYHAFRMAFGGAGFAVSYPLAEALVNNLDVCIKRYPTLYGYDHILQSCITDLGVSLTQEKGFHQIDLHWDLSGYLSSHPQSPLVSLHHFDFAKPLFPSMNSTQSVNHLMKAAKVDSSRLLQQTVCHDNKKNWTFSISWGYSAHIYEAIFPPSHLHRPLETFTPWSKSAVPFYMFNTRLLSKNPCEAPHVFYFDSFEKFVGNYVVTNYTRRFPRKLSACTLPGHYSADHISKIRLLSPLRRLDGVGSRRECCNVIRAEVSNLVEVKLRACMKNEIVR